MENSISDGGRTRTSSSKMNHSKNEHDEPDKDHLADAARAPAQAPKIMRSSPSSGTGASSVRTTTSSTTVASLIQSAAKISLLDNDDRHHHQHNSSNAEQPAGAGGGGGDPQCRTTV